MKDTFRKIFAGLLAHFESGEGEFRYEKSHRIVLVIIGVLFSGLALSVIVVGIIYSQIAVVLPGLIFCGVGVTSLVIGALGSDRAVAKIWGNT